MNGGLWFLMGVFATCLVIAVWGLLRLAWWRNWSGEEEDKGRFAPKSKPPGEDTRKKG
jgi:hypothetical protein